jgi:hypothetical protein
VANHVSQTLLERLPRTFVPALNEQMRRWDLLFPAERRTIGAQMDWLERLSDGDFRALFQPVVSIEKQMGLPASTLNAGGLSIVDTGILVRSPYYRQWRAATENIFGTIDAGVKSEGRLKPHNRLVVCVMPGGVPHSGPLWPRLEKQGKWLPLNAPFSSVLPMLFQAVAERRGGPDLEPVERTWAFEYGSQFQAPGAGERAVTLSFDELGPVRREFLVRLNAIDRNLQSVDKTYDNLRRLELPGGLEDRFGAQVSEFVRTLFLSGNGALLFGNSFVQWSASEAMRRAAPQAVFCRFGIRPKLKPFSSVALFEDQYRANPVPDAPDQEGSFIDSRLLVEYVYLAATRAADGPERLLALCAAPEQDRVLAVGAVSALADLGGATGAGTSQLCAAALSWLAKGDV